MATQSTSALIYDISTDARFRAMSQFVEDTLVTVGGWKVTPDTGQTLPSALAHPTAINQKQGYRIYRMNDPLQTTFPVFLRIDFGSTANNALTPGYWLTIGTGSDGVGNITGILLNGGATVNATVNGSNASNPVGTAALSYGSADPGRFSICLCSNSVSAFTTVIFTLERSKDAIGNDTGDGLQLIYKTGGNSGFMDASRYIRFSGTQPALEPCLHYILSSKNPGQMFFPGDVGVGIVILIASIAQQPGTNMLVTNSGDVTADSTISLTLYSHIRTYVHCGIVGTNKPLTTAGGGSPLDTISRILMRYD